MMDLNEDCCCKGSFRDFISHTLAQRGSRCLGHCVQPLSREPCLGLGYAIRLSRFQLDDWRAPHLFLPRAQKVCSHVRSLPCRKLKPRFRRIWGRLKEQDEKHMPTEADLRKKSKSDRYEIPMSETGPLSANSAEVLGDFLPSVFDCLSFS